MHLAWTHFSHAIHNTKLDVALVSLTPQESILLSNVFSFFPLIINLVFPRLTFIPLLSNASLHSSKFSLNFYIVSPIWTNRLRKEFDSSNLFFCILRYFIYHHGKQQRRQYRSLVYTNFHRKFLRQVQSNSKFRFCSFIKTHYRLDQDFRQTFLSHSPFHHFSRYSVKCRASSKTKLCFIKIN